MSFSNWKVFAALIQAKSNQIFNQADYFSLLKKLSRSLNPFRKLLIFHHKNSLQDLSRIFGTHSLTWHFILRTKQDLRLRGFKKLIPQSSKCLQVIIFTLTLFCYEYIPPSPFTVAWLIQSVLQQLIRKPCCF